MSIFATPMVKNSQKRIKRRRVLRWALTVLLGACMVCLYFWLYISVFHLELPKTMLLRSANADWQARASVINSSLDIYDKTLTGIEERNDNVYRSIYGLPEIGHEGRYILSSSDSRYSYLDKQGASSILKRLVRRSDALDIRICEQGRALEEVGMLAMQTGDMSACVPSISPIFPDRNKYHVSSRFGYRRDPVYGGGEYHTGVDFALPKGSPVYAVGDGVVTKVKYQFSGYGNEVFIDHGFGYQTHYAHLQVIFVNEGMKIRRGQKIATVGNSGKSTGPHLHYEVIYKNKKVNPMNFVDMEMSREEYSQMTAARQEESPSGKRKSTSEILRRRR